MAIGAAPWRARRLPGAGTAVSSAVPRLPEASEAPERDLAAPSARQQRRYARAERAGLAAATRDRFLDVIVLLSVLVFVVLVAGLGLLVLQNALQR